MSQYFKKHFFSIFSFKHNPCFKPQFPLIFQRQKKMHPHFQKLCHFKAVFFQRATKRTLASAILFDDVSKIW